MCRMCVNTNIQPWTMHPIQKLQSYVDICVDTQSTHTHSSSTLLSPPSGCSRLSSALSKPQLVDLNFKLLVCPTPQADSLAMCVIYIFWHNRRRLFNVCRRHKMTVRPDWLIRTGSPSHAQQKIRADICIICSKGCWQTKIYIYKEITMRSSQIVVDFPKTRVHLRAQILRGDNMCRAKGIYLYIKIRVPPEQMMMFVFTVNKASGISGHPAAQRFISIQLLKHFAHLPKGAPYCRGRVPIIPTTTTTTIS